MAQQVTIGGWLMARGAYLEHLACGVPAEYEKGLTDQASVLYDVAAEFGDEYAEQLRAQWRANQGPYQREFYEISGSWFDEPIRTQPNLWS
jgi:hypothetical protein